VQILFATVPRVCWNEGYNVAREFEISEVNRHSTSSRCLADPSYAQDETLSIRFSLFGHCPFDLACTDMGSTCRDFPLGSLTPVSAMTVT
jgi:hypothetical protein